MTEILETIVTEILYYVPCPHCGSLECLDFNPVGTTWKCDLCEKSYTVVE